ncbi:acetolactate synthase AlsS [soil metagenome]
MNCAQALVRMLENMGITHVFGIPGAKIDAVFIALLDSKIELVVCRHEQNAAFMASTMGRITGRVGVCLVTSGPGVSNLTTGLLTATSEGSPVLAIGGEVPLEDRLKQTHQSFDGVSVLRPVTKYAAEVVAPSELGDILGNAVRAAESGRPGAAFLSFPKDISLAPYEGEFPATLGRPLKQGPGAKSELEKAAELINASRKPVILLGLQSSDPRDQEAIRHFVRSSTFPYVSTFQGAGSWAGSKEGAQFGGRVGIFSHQPGDRLLQDSDCVITIGYAPIEYDTSLWNATRQGSLIAIDVIPSDQDRHFLPDAEIVGDLGASLELLLPLLGQTQFDPNYRDELADVRRELEEIVAAGAGHSEFPMHPLRVMHELRQVVTDQTTLSLDIGSMYIWMDRHFLSSFPRQFLVSNGQQTLGVALPSAMAANLARPGTPIISLSGDGGFLFSAMELETAKRIGSRFVHLIWDSGSYDMVAFQEEAHYSGRTAGITLGQIDVVAFAESFGCKGIQISHPDELAPALREALASPVPVLINIPIDYSDNLKLMHEVHQAAIH